MTTRLALAALLLSLPAAALAAKGKAPAPHVRVPVNFISAEGVQKAAGVVTLRETKEGLSVEPHLKGLSPGEHGFHVHEKGSCDPGEKDGKKGAGLAAGPHLDPDATKAHKGPAGGGHKGDLPKLVADAKGVARGKLLVKGLTLADVLGRSLMIHAGGDNYSDDPKPLGGGGERVACGVIPASR